MPFAVAVMVAAVAAVTLVVLTVNVELVAPAGMRIKPEAGTTAAALLLDSATATPPAGAGPSSITVPVEDAPPVTLDGETEIPVRVGSTTVIAVVTTVVVPTNVVVT